jgi:CRP-like cAMP-binding protein/RsiW-degrading membrane proteinase PrsW (M82 family)
MTPTLLISYLIAIMLPLVALYLLSTFDLFGTGKGSTIRISFAWGAVAAFALAYVVNNTVVRFVGYVTVVTLTAPIVEEILKSLILAYWVQRPRFRYIVDGAVYGFAAGIGFAISENVFYLSTHPGNSLALAISRVLSTTLMHAAASAMVGIALGHLRRSRNAMKLVWSFLGIGLAISLHVVYNNIVDKLTGSALLLVAIAIGTGGGVVIGLLVNRGLVDEKKRFQETLGLSLGVSSGERKAIQQLGGDAIEKVLDELAGYFGADKIEKIRRVLVIQANIGILQNNLNSPVSERLRAAWQEEITALRAETNQLRNELGVYVMGFLRGVFPPDQDAAASPLNHALTQSDPTVIHSFDIFMTASKLADSIPPDQLEATAQLLKQAEFFKDVSLADLENLSRAIVSRTYGGGQVLFEEGDEGDALYLIRKGGIDILTEVDGEERLLRTMRPGEIVGELALLDGQPRSATARAKDQATVLMLRREQFIMFMQSRPQVILAVLRYLARRVRHVTEVVETSINWASHIAQGDYEQAKAVGSTGAALAPGSSPAIELTGPVGQVAPTRLEAVSADAPVHLGGAFAMIASALEQREQAFQKKFEAAGVMTAEMAELPSEQQEVMKFFIHDQMASAQGVTVELLQAKLTHVVNLPAIVSELTNNDWLIAVDTPPHVRYKANPKRRRTKPIPLFKGMGKAGG